MNQTTPAKRKFNVLDVIIILAVIAALVFVGMKFFGNKEEVVEETESYIVTFYGEELPDFVLAQFENGADVYDDALQDVVGTVVDHEINDSVTYVTTDDGEIKMTKKIGHHSLKLACEIEGTRFSNGLIVGSAKYGVGHSLVIRADDAKMYLRVYDIQTKEEFEAEQAKKEDKTGKKPVKKSEDTTAVTEAVETKAAKEESAA